MKPNRLVLVCALSAASCGWRPPQEAGKKPASSMSETASKPVMIAKPITIADLKACARRVTVYEPEPPKPPEPEPIPLPTVEDMDVGSYGYTVALVRRGQQLFIIKGETITAKAQKDDIGSMHDIHIRRTLTGVEVDCGSSIFVSIEWQGQMSYLIPVVGEFRMPSRNSK